MASDCLPHQVLSGQPSDDAACGGCKCMQFLLSFQKRKRLPNLRAEDVHDVLIPLWLHKEAAAKDAAGRALRRAFECLRLRHDWPLIAPLTGHSLATHCDDDL